MLSAAVPRWDIGAGGKVGAGVAEGTRRRGLGRERPLRRCNRPNRQLGPERPAADYPLVAGGNLGLRCGPAGPPCFVVLNGWEWPGDRLVRLPVGSRDVTIDGPQQTLCQAEVAELVEQVAAGRTAIHLDLVTQYGESIPAIAQAVRHTVTKRIQDLTGLEITEVNITVGDITPEPQPR
jgi:hypothetical protein